MGPPRRGGQPIGSLEGADGTGLLIAGWIAHTLSEEIAEEQLKETHPKMGQMLG